MRVFLGLSLATALSNPSSNDLIIDIWEGGSALYGWDIMNACLDRLPLLVKEPVCIKGLGGEPVEVDVATEFIGMERDITRKLDLTDLSMFWPFKFSRKAYIPVEGWCSLFRRIISKLRSKRIFGEIKYIDPEERELRVSWWRKLRYDEIYSTMPLDYLIKKLKATNSVQDALNSIPIYVASLLLKSEVNEVKIYYLGKKKYSSVAVIHLPLYEKGFQGYSVAYVIIPYKPFRNQGAFREKAISDAKKLGLVKSEPLSIRGYFEKYGVLLGELSARDELRKYGIILSGRLGKWRELGICDVFRELKGA